MTRNGIATAIQTFTQIKQLDKETRNLLERRTFFDGAGRIRATLQNTHKLVGFEIVPVRALGVTAKIEKIGLQMTGGTGMVKMYLFHSSQIDPIKTFDLDFQPRQIQRESSLRLVYTDGLYRHRLSPIVLSCNCRCLSRTCSWSSVFQKTSSERASQTASHEASRPIH